MTSDYFWWFLTFQEYRFTLKDSWFQNVLLVRKLLPRNQRNYFWISALKFFVASLGLPGSFWGLPEGFLMYDITQEAPRKLQKNSGQKSRNHFVGIFVQTIIPKGHFEINWPLDQPWYFDQNVNVYCPF